MITQQELKERLHYDLDTGIFTWLTCKQRSGKVPGDVAGGDNGNGYVVIKLNKYIYLAHRLAWLYVNGCWPREFIDHQNRVRSDNRYCNLREATRTENKRNQKIQSNNSTGFKGVCLKKSTGKFRALCGVDGKQHEIGLYDTAEEAHDAYVAFAKQHHKQFFRVA